MGETPRLQATPSGGLRYDGRMNTYRKGSHCVYLLHYHFVFIPKYRKPVLRGDVAVRTRDLIRRICAENDVEILQGHVRPDHVHLLLGMPPTMAPSRAMQAIKGKTSYLLLRDFRALRKEFWGRHLWARGFFVATSGNVTDEVIAKYIESQDVEPQNDDVFKISE
jgi:putative transposase